jgi:hypothetical protein
MAVSSQNSFRRHERLNDFLSAKQFRIRPDTTSSRWIPVRIEDAMLYDAEYRDRIFQVQVTFDLIDPVAMTAIYLDVPGFDLQMISDFPRCLLRRDSTTCKIRAFLSGLVFHLKNANHAFIPSNSLTVNPHPLPGQLLKNRPASVTDTQASGSLTGADVEQSTARQEMNLIHIKIELVANKVGTQYEAIKRSPMFARIIFLGSYDPESETTLNLGDSLG